MHKYRINIKKVSGRLNESVLPSKSLVVKSKTKKSKSAVLSEASKFYKEKYGIMIESADVESDTKFVAIIDSCIRVNVHTDDDTRMNVDGKMIGFSTKDELIKNFEKIFGLKDISDANFDYDEVDDTYYAHLDGKNFTYSFVFNVFQKPSQPVKLW